MAATFALGASLDVPDNAKIARVETVMSTSEFQTDPNPTSQYTARNVRYAPSQYGGGKAQGVLVSTYKSSVTDVYAQAICFDAVGKVNGGGFTFVDLVPAGRSTGVSISVDTSGKTAKCDIYAAPSNLSKTK